MLDAFRQQFDAQSSKGQSFDQLMSGHNGASIALQQIVLSFVDRSYRFNVASAFSKLDPENRRRASWVLTAHECHDTFGMLSVIDLCREYPRLNELYDPADEMRALIRKNLG
jgi:hypothetical protein